jgi:hypothetical protein
MRKQSILTLIMIPLIFDFGLTKIEGTIIYDDGQIHDITWLLEDDVFVKDSINEESTTLRLLPISAVNGSVEVFNSSEVFIEGGYIYHYLRAYDRSQVTMSDGYVGMQFFAENHSDVTLTGGLIDDHLSINGSSILSISGGHIAGELTANNTSKVMITGGQLGTHLRAFADSEVEMSGGSMAERLYTYTSGTVTLHGTDFQINSEPVFYGIYSNADYNSGILSGTLLSGDTFTTDFAIFDESRIILIPEPSTLLLLSLGVLMLRKRN